MVKPAEALARVPLLAGLKKREVQRLAKSMRERRFQPGENVVVEGRQGVGFFLIVDGRAAVTVGGEVVNMLGPGDYFGEIALLRGNIRTATVTADTELRCLAMTAWQFKPWVAEHPQVSWALLETIAERLGEAQARSPT
jgi:CRP-like cAMP-binding protein